VWSTLLRPKTPPPIRRRWDCWVFWLSLVALSVMPKLGVAEANESAAMAFTLLVGGLFTAFMFLGTLRINCALQVVFALLAASDFIGSTGLKTFAGYEGILCGLSAFYTAIAQVLNEVYKREVLPLGAVK
jgi:succinate-acetate transporter protein